MNLSKEEEKYWEDLISGKRKPADIYEEEALRQLKLKKERETTKKSNVFKDFNKGWKAGWNESGGPDVMEEIKEDVITGAKRTGNLFWGLIKYFAVLFALLLFFILIKNCGG